MATLHCTEQSLESWIGKVKAGIRRLESWKGGKIQLEGNWKRLENEEFCSCNAEWKFLLCRDIRFALRVSNPTKRIFNQIPAQLSPTRWRENVRKMLAHRSGCWNSTIASSFIVSFIAFPSGRHIGELRSNAQSKQANSCSSRYPSSVFCLRLEERLIKVILLEVRKESFLETTVLLSNVSLLKLPCVRHSIVPNQCTHCVVDKGSFLSTNRFAFHIFSDSVSVVKPMS